MSHTPNPRGDPDLPIVYHIRIKGHLGPQWADWFEGLDITPEATGETLLSGPVVDQAALYGLLRKVRDLGLPLVSVSRDAAAEAGSSDVTDDIEASGQ